MKNMKMLLTVGVIVTAMLLTVGLGEALAGEDNWLPIWTGGFTNATLSLTNEGYRVTTLEHVMLDHHHTNSATYTLSIVPSGCMMTNVVAPSWTTEQSTPCAWTNLHLPLFAGDLIRITSSAAASAETNRYGIYRREARY